MELVQFSLERVLKTLERFGLTRLDAKVYVRLAKTGPQEGRRLKKDLTVTKQQLYPSLKNLQKKGLVTSSRTRPAVFRALAFEELLNLYVKINIDQALITKETREELLASWRNLVRKNNT